MRPDWDAIRGLILDIDGTLFRGEEPIGDPAELFRRLDAQGYRYVIATNNTKSAAVYQRRFERHGLHLLAEHILTCAEATARYLQQRFPERSCVYVIGKSALVEEIADRGFQILSGRERQADLVVVGGDFDLTYEKLKNAVLHIQDGARLIGTNPDLLIPTEEGLVPEAGTTLAALEAATGIHPVIIGKPEPILFEMAIRKMGLSPHEVLMVGDRLDTDIKGARQAGLHSALVETGVDRAEGVRQKGIHPDGVYTDVSAVLDVLMD